MVPHKVWVKQKYVAVSTERDLGSESDTAIQASAFRNSGKNKQPIHQNGFCPLLATGYTMNN